MKIKMVRMSIEPHMNGTALRLRVDTEEAPQVHEVLERIELRDDVSFLDYMIEKVVLEMKDHLRKNA